MKAEKVHPTLVSASTQETADLFHYDLLLWSVPVSTGYGRRMRFLVFDEGKVFTIIARASALLRVYNVRLGIRR